MQDQRSQSTTDKVNNKFDLILVASARVRELRKGHAPKIKTKSRECVTALNEVEQGFIGRDYLKKIR